MHTFHWVPADKRRHASLAPGDHLSLRQAAVFARGVKRTGMDS